MKPNPVHRLPAPLEAAVQSLKLAARQAVERSIEGLGLAALAAGNAFARDGLLGAQFELNRKSALFALRFNDALDERIVRELAPRSPANAAPPAAAPAPPTTLQRPGQGTGPASMAPWESFSLVEDREMDDKISAERLAMEIGHGCEWELRELDAYVRSLLPPTPPAAGIAGLEVIEPEPTQPNPLRPEVVAHALFQGIAAVSDRPEIAKVLAGELGRGRGGDLAPAHPGVGGGVGPRG
ncbi:MAG: hypothetical protein ACOVOT_01450, partial [Rubrivivax sp.]